ncbi:hypothetical protein QO005_004610 [Rhizobium paknamense]|uniref:Uncharacterized protein n=1 Tax=Rhizobium paknamense TaxID=1206817 RepID=A0ABU0IJ14_9HYPH|nr:hypothetical protein [Rhizobium paknamense]
MRYTDRQYLFTRDPQTSDINPISAEATEPSGRIQPVLAVKLLKARGTIMMTRKFCRASTMPPSMSCSLDRRLRSGTQPGLAVPAGRKKIL